MQADKANLKPGMMTVDPCTLSNPQHVKVTHMDMQLAVDFASKTITGEQDL